MITSIDINKTFEYPDSKYTFSVAGIKEGKHCVYGAMNITGEYSTALLSKTKKEFEHKKSMVETAFNARTFYMNTMNGTTFIDEIVFATIRITMLSTFDKKYDIEFIILTSYPFLFEPELQNKWDKFRKKYTN